MVSMVLSTMDYDQLGTKPGHEVWTRSLDTKSGHEVILNRLSLGTLFARPAVRIYKLILLSLRYGRHQLSLTDDHWARHSSVDRQIHLYLIGCHSFIISLQYLSSKFVTSFETSA